MGATLNLRVSPILRSVLEEAAAQDSRDLSGQVRKILVDWAGNRIASHTEATAA
jgi:hypothetical protein